MYAAASLALGSSSLLYVSLKQCKEERGNQMEMDGLSWPCQNDQRHQPGYISFCAARKNGE